ncbi:NAD(P)H-dependent oxidoreductase [Vineibacter terrae]|uniref:NAD(P)H-dependent oxidoreductase n=1 Tax=Vineibacter terrae TaxID=2586908 RepID=A0A5C8PWR7_9HYPH|nr:NAD(P)H-dependent oxidoreductase [Vineibacter terrae]TXL82299.1 NAD(P)H-dependent oxidoreductase [Vineibacter terrae]
MSQGPITVAGLCGSLRKASFNRMALAVFTQNLPQGVTVAPVEIGAFPLYNQEIMEAGVPAAVAQARDTILAADAVVIATPEYNYSTSGVLKNAIDWLSRTTPQPFAAKPLALLGASMGMLGTARAQYHIRQIMVFLDGRPINKPEVMIGAAHTKFGPDGTLKDEMAVKLITDLGAALVREIHRHRAAAAAG